MQLLGSYFPNQGSHLGLPAVRALSPNHWIAKEFPIVWLFKVTPTHCRKLRETKRTKKKTKIIFHPPFL